MSDTPPPPPVPAGDSPESKREAKARAKAEKAYAKASRPWYKKKRFVIPLAVVALGIIGSLSSGGSSTDLATDTASDTGQDGAQSDAAGRDDQPDQDEAQSADEAKTARLGQSARDGLFEFTVNGIECGHDSVGDDTFGDEAQGQFCLLDVTVTNIGDEPQYLFADNQYLFDDQGRKFSADGEATLWLDPDGQTLFEEINPGNSISGVIVFDVPVDATIVTASLHDSAFSGGIEVELR